jgi:hypothetical protein
MRVLQACIWLIEHVVAREHRVIVFSPCYIAAAERTHEESLALQEKQAYLAQGGQYV